MSNEILLNKVKDTLIEHVHKEFKNQNGLDHFGYFNINWIDIKEDSVTLQFVMSQLMSNYIHTVSILNELFLGLFRRKLSQPVIDSRDHINHKEIRYHRLTLSYEDLAYVYTYLSLKWR